MSILVVGYLNLKEVVLARSHINIADGSLNIWKSLINREEPHVLF